MKVYFDNAATTPILPEVIDEMCSVLKNNFGNPSSTHAFGRKSKGIIETSRRLIASLLNCHSSEIFFTSGGTEADNMAFITAIEQLNCKHLITSNIEHHAVGHSAEKFSKLYNIPLSIVNVNEFGEVNYQHLEELLSKNPNSFVSLMHANNEIGTLNDIIKINNICKKHNAIFHSDTVQTMGHYAFDLNELNIDFLTCSAHKFHGPKGIGFLYVNKKHKPSNVIHGGSQERGYRAGTENLAGIAALAKALEIATLNVEIHQKHVLELKQYFIEQLQENLPFVKFNGHISEDKSLYTVLNCSLPQNEHSGMLLFMLDLNGIACSGGSACTSGATKGSHVLAGINADKERTAVRFSFSHLNKKEEVDYTISQLCKLYQHEKVS